MISIEQIRQNQNHIIVLGNHELLVQSILDFDYLSNHQPSVIGIISGRSGFTKYFWGQSEILIPTMSVFESLRGSVRPYYNLWLLNLSSGRRTLSSTIEILKGESLQGFTGAALFAENVPELHSLKLITEYTAYTESTESTKLIIGPASVGLVVPGALKLGPIGGITPDQIEESALTTPGALAVLSASGGMTNELINIAIQAGHRLSFALSFGGDRFPVLSPREAFLLAEQDPQTQVVLYYGELGGEDEYELVSLKKEGLFTKPVIAHIAGTVASLFPESPQFGHAKAKADKTRVTALAKRKVMKSAGFQVSNSFSEFIKLVTNLEH